MGRVYLPTACIAKSQFMEQFKLQLLCCRFQKSPIVDNQLHFALHLAIDYCCISLHT